MAARNSDGIRQTISAGVLEIVLDRPEVLNAMDTAVHRAIIGAIAAAEENPDVGAVLIRGEGRAFSSGSDLKEIGQLVGEAEQRYVELDFSTKNIVAMSTKPTVAAIHGYCLGGGLELALACDIRLGADDAIFGMPEVSLGSLPGSGGLQRLPEVVGVGIATEWILTGRRVPAAEAWQRGLVSQLYPVDMLVAEARALAEKLAGQSLLAMRLARVAIRPAPLSHRSLVGTFQALAGDMTHRQDSYRKTTERFSP
jgi:enoyl-CoA hydratase/carnithine racemase